MGIYYIEQVYLMPYVYSFCQIFQALRLFPTLRLLGTLEYVIKKGQTYFMNVLYRPFVSQGIDFF